MKKIGLAAAMVLSCAWCWGQQVPPRKTIELPGGKAKEYPAGTYTDTWESLREHYRVPEWFKDAKFGIFMHWGVYSVPAAGSEWYPKHMYNGMLADHTQKWGSPDKFGYKDFIPLFRAEKFDPAAWADLFVEAGARYVIPTAEHHDGFALYDSDLTRWDAVDAGPHRDLIGELAEAVRARGLKFGVSNHRIENWDFMYPGATDAHDLFDPEYADLYGPPQMPTEASGMGPAAGDGNTRHPQSDAFLEEWLARAQEIVDKYRPDLFYFDNGVNYRSLDPWKLRFAAYYYNSAEQWGGQVSIQTKSDAYLYGTIRDFERESRAPKRITDYYWQVDDPIGHKFGYVEGLKLQSAGNVVKNLVENICRNGNLCLNISPKADGTIPDDQQAVLRGVGRWLKTNGEGVYGSRAWRLFGEGPSVEGSDAPEEWRFTCQGAKRLYAFAMKWDGGRTVIRSLDSSAEQVRRVSLLGGGRLKFSQRPDGLHIEAPAEKPGEYIAVFAIELR